MSAIDQKTIKETLAGVKDHAIEDEPTEVPTSNLPDRDTVVVPAMVAELQVLHLGDVEAKAKAAKKAGTPVLPPGPNGDPYLTADNIAPCFWLPRKEEYSPGGKRWLEDALFIFAHSRAFDYESAAKRFFKFNHEALLAGIVSLDEIPQDVAETISCSGLYYHPPNTDAGGRSVVYASVKDFTFYDGYTLMQMKRMNMWLFWQWSIRHAPAPQIHGLVFVVSYTGMSMGCINNEYKAWTDKVMLEMLPLKIASVVLAYPPFWVNSLLWPMIRLVMKQKILDRIQWLGNDPVKVKAKYLMFSHHVPTGLFTTKPASLAKFCLAQKIQIPKSTLSTGELQDLLATVPLEFGGTFDINPTTVRAHVAATWKVSDEVIPEGCVKVAPPVKSSSWF